MKKTYINPTMEVVVMKMQGNILLPISGTTDHVDSREMMFFDEQ
jgi:hypothetical protein